MPAVDAIVTIAPPWATRCGSAYFRVEERADQVHAERPLERRELDAGQRLHVAGSKMPALVTRPRSAPRGADRSHRSPHAPRLRPNVAGSAEHAAPAPRERVAAASGRSASRSTSAHGSAFADEARRGGFSDATGRAGHEYGTSSKTGHAHGIERPAAQCKAGKGNTARSKTRGAMGRTRPLVR